MAKSLLWIILLTVIARLATCKSYKQGDPIQVYYNKIFSLKNQLTYSYSSLPFICPNQLSNSNGPQRKKSTLVFDQDLRGDRLVQSDYKINFLENQECKLLCKQPWNVEDAINVEELIADDYLVEWELDGMPGVTVTYTNESPEQKYKTGFPLGFRKDGSTYVNNHVIFQVLYTPDRNEQGKYKVIGFEIYPDSIIEGECTKKSVEYERQQVTGHKTLVAFSYSVQWKQVKETDLVENASRWDAFLCKPNPERHFFAMANGLFVVAVVFVSILMILVKTFHKDNSNSEDDIKVYNDVDDFVGWKLINRDVFRRPMYGGLLTPVMGSGIQLVIVAIGLIGTLHMNWFHPAEPRSLTRWFTLFFLLGTVPAGYWSARIYKVFRGKAWVLNGILTSTVVPSVFLAVIFGLSLIAWSQGSSLAISFSGWMSLLSIWLFASMPLTLIGAYMGEKRERIEYPSRTTQIPRIIPKKRWFQRNVVCVIIGGILPFAVIFLNWHELLISVNKGELVLSTFNTVVIWSLMLVATCETTVVLIFLQLCSEDYLWWWQSFMIGASPALYMFGHGVFYFMKYTDIKGLLSGTIYIVNLLLVCGLLGVCTGTLGFLSSYLIIRRVYSSVKVIS